MEKEILTIKDLTIEFGETGYRKTALQGFNLSVAESEVVGIVGESGSGKTVTAHAINGILPDTAHITSGSIEFMGENLLNLNEKKLRHICGSQMGMIFQEPLTSLNPVYKIGKQVEEALILHTNLSADARKKRAIEMLSCVEIKNPDKVYDMYPHQLSGGMRQRVMIAAALIHSPKLLIADEPTTALDVMIQAQIIQLLIKLNKELDVGIIFISHNLLVVKKLCSRIVVMEKSKIVEQGRTYDIFNNPSCDYTKQLISSLHIWHQSAAFEALPAS